MTKKDFELIAATLRALLFENAGGCTPQAAKVHAYLSADFADRLKATNKQFNRDKFLRACGCSL
jgi:hypothetical protein